MQDAIVSASKIYLRISGLKLTRTNKIALGNTSVKDSENVHTVLFKNLPPELRSELINNHAKALLELSTGSYDSELRTAIVDALRAAKRPKSFEMPFDMTVPVPLSKIRLIHPVECSDDSFLYDPETEIDYSHERKSTLSKLKQHLPDDDMRAQWLAEHSDDRLLRYKPYAPRTYEDENKRMCFNNWKRPAYWSDWDLDDSVTELPSEFLKAFTHTFPNEVERPAILSWMRQALFYRETAILLLTGLQGSGKGVFFQSILGNLVGQTNLTKAAANFESSAFHGDIRGKTVFVLNELSLTKTIKNKLKDLSDGRSTLNEKFQKNGGLEPIHASFIVVNNYPSDNYLEFADRKFFAPAVSDQKLDDAFSEEWVTDFCANTCTNQDFLRQIASYLYYRVEKLAVYPKTEMFYTICYMCLHWYLKKFLIMCKHKNTFSEKDMGQKNGKGLNVYELVERLQIYERETKQKVAEITENVKGWTAKSFVCANDNSETGSGM